MFSLILGLEIEYVVVVDNFSPSHYVFTMDKGSEPDGGVRKYSGNPLTHGTRYNQDHNVQYHAIM